MALYRQSAPDHLTTATTPYNHHYTNGGPTTTSLDQISIGIRSMTHKLPRHHHHRRSKSSPRRISITALITFLCFLVALSGFVFLFLSSSHHPDVADTSDAQDDDFKNDFLTNVTRFTTSQVKFGRGSVTHVRDSRYWDGDDRRRDEDYNEDAVHKSNGSNEGIFGKGHFHGKGETLLKKSDDSKDSNNHGLYNEAGRNELKMYEKKYEASLKSVGQVSGQTDEGNHVLDRGNLDLENEEFDTEDEYDDEIDPQDANVHYDNARHKIEANSAVSNSYVEDGVNNVAKGHNTHNVPVEGSSHDSSSKSYNVHNPDDEQKHASVADGQSKTGLEKLSKKPSRRRKSSSQCEMKLLESAAQLVEPLESKKFARFSLLYTEKEVKPDGIDDWEPRFAGHQSLREREDSFLARDQKIHCGFIKGPAGYSSTGFDLAVNDVRFISKCYIAVISAIFGNSDHLRSPFSKLVSRLSRKNVCFVMFMDEVTLHTLSSEGQIPDRMGFIGLWRVVVVKNLPYSDMRRVGKIPKLLSHRLFPSARYSIWLDSKLRLQQDPLLLLEYLLWRKGHEYAISNHYDRHCVWEEVARNKKLNKFNHTMIDQQFAFYRADGLKRFNASDPNKLLPSNVPEGSLIIRAHTPMSNLFSCLWFNEVDRFTPRDQLSFAFTYQKLRKKNPGKPFYLHMFKDCERRKIAKLFHHRTKEKQIATHDVV